MSYPTLTGGAVEGMLLHKVQASLGVSYANSTYQFFLTGTSTPANVFQDGNLTTPYPITGYVQADSFGRFPPIYLDPSITYRVQFYDSTNTLRYQIDPYTPLMSTRGTSQNVTYGMQVATTGEVTIPAPNSGGTGINLTLKSNILGVVPVKLQGSLAGNPAIIINSSATTGAQNATFTATNKPGTATSSPAGWLPIQCDSVQYYAPIWHSNNFTPYSAQPTALGEVINAITFAFNGNGTTTVTGGTATPANWFTPLSTAIGSGYYFGMTSVAAQPLSGVRIVYPATLTGVPAGGAYMGGTLSSAWQGTSGTYTVQFATGQLVTGCTLSNGLTTFTCPPTSVNAGATTSIYVWLTAGLGQYYNIGSGGTAALLGNAVGVGVTNNYTLSTSLSGTPAVVSGTISLLGSFGPNSVVYNVNVISGNLILNGDGTATANGASTTGWWGNSASLANVGANYWINITQTGSSPGGFSFSAAQGAWTNITNSVPGLSIGITPTPTGPTTITGTYQIALDSAGVNVVGSGSITLNGGTAVQSVNWSGSSASAPTVVLSGAGATTVDGGAVTGWYVPNVSNIGSGYYINVTRTGGTSGVNFSAAQGAWTNITSSGLTIGISGYTGDVGTATASGTYQISSASGGSPVLGSGTISLSITGLTKINIHTTGSSATETIPTGTTTVQAEVWGGGGGGAGQQGSGCSQGSGATGGCGGFAYKSYTAASLGGTGKTFQYTVGAGGAGGAPSANGSNGATSQIIAGTVTGFTSLVGNLGTGGTGRSGGGTGGTGTGGSRNVTGATQSTTGTTGSISGDGGPYGAGGAGAFSGTGGTGGHGAAVFYYT